MSIETSQLGPYRIVRTLAAGESFECLDARGRRVVLKRLESDCLLRGQPHPSIKDRLARVRELALRHVATLHAVERLNDAAWLVWDFVEGDTFEHHAAMEPRTGARLAATARELIRSVESLHAQGIVHGALHGRNVIVSPAGQVWLTHVSPLLYNDPAEDAAALARLLRDVAGQPPLTKSGAARLTIRQLASHLGVQNDAPAANVGRDGRERWVRRRSLIAAVMVAALGLGTAVIIYRLASARNSAAASPGEWGRLDEVPVGR